MEMISVRNLKKTYGEVTAVDGISFEICRGEIFGLLGPNGAGKTSTINMIIGLSRPTAGDITIAGIDVRQQTKKAQALMGIVPDESNLYNEMDGFDNLCFCAALYGMSKKREPKALQLLEQFRLKDAGKRPFKAYSRGCAVNWPSRRRSSTLPKYCFWMSRRRGLTSKVPGKSGHDCGTETARDDDPSHYPLHRGSGAHLRPHCLLSGGTHRRVGHCPRIDGSSHTRSRYSFRYE